MTRDDENVYVYIYIFFFLSASIYEVNGIRARYLSGRGRMIFIASLVRVVTRPSPCRYDNYCGKGQSCFTLWKSVGAIRTGAARGI